VRKKGERERKGEKERKERESLEQNIQRDPSPLQIFLVCHSINKVRGSEIKLFFYINLDKLI